MNNEIKKLRDNIYNLFFDENISEEAVEELLTLVDSAASIYEQREELNQIVQEKLAQVFTDGWRAALAHHAPQLAAVTGLEAALNKIIEMEIMEAYDRYGDKARAETNCTVIVARTALEQYKDAITKGEGDK